MTDDEIKEAYTQLENKEAAKWAKHNTDGARVNKWLGWLFLFWAVYLVVYLLYTWLKK